MFRFILCIALFVAVERFCHKQTRGFTVQKIALSSPLPTPSEKCPAEIEQVLRQPFYFLDKGGQCFAFLSADGTVVLKLFKQHHIRFWRWLETLPLPSFMNPYREEVLQKHLHQSSSIFKSVRIAEQLFKQETGILFSQIDETLSVGSALLLVDALGIPTQSICPPPNLCSNTTQNCLTSS